MQVINIDVTGKQTFFCVGKQYDKNATVIYFRGLELSSGAQLYLTVGGTRYSLSNPSFVINEYLTNLSGDYKAQLIVKDGYSETVIRIFTFRVESVGYQTHEMDGDNEPVLTTEDCEKTVAEYVNDNQEMLRGPRGEPGETDGLLVTEPDRSSLVYESDDCTMAVSGLKIAKYGGIVTLDLDLTYENKSAEEYTYPTFSIDMQEAIGLTPTSSVLPVYLYAVNEDGSYVDLAGQCSMCIKDGVLIGKVLDESDTIHGKVIFLTAD